MVENGRTSEFDFATEKDPTLGRSETVLGGRAERTQRPNGCRRESYFGGVSTLGRESLLRENTCVGQSRQRDFLGQTQTMSTSRDEGGEKEIVRE